MKFTAKVFFCTIIVIALAMGFGGYLLISSTFNAAINREIRQALNESAILCFAIETVALNIPTKYDSLQDKTIGEIAASLETGRYIKISDELRQPLYTGPYFTGFDGLLDMVDENTEACEIVARDGRYLVYTALMFRTAEKLLYMETLKDITTIFAERDQSFMIYRNVTIITLIFGAFIMYIVSVWLTRPISALARVTRDMASGKYDRRAKKLTSDELGLLTEDFNRMADSLQNKMDELREEASAKERFIAAFSHELKTPLTAIIGYADLLRSRKLNDEQLFLSADYVYREGKRLEDLSLRLLDIIVLKREGLNLRDTPVSPIFNAVHDTFSGWENVSVKYDNAVIKTEASLLTTTLINITDNAVKASDEGSPIEITGRIIESGYEVSVRDYGRGIAQDEIGKLTQAFYMVNKSRSRSSGGAGLGLALCAEILELFGSVLEIDSELGEGTRVSFVLPESLQEPV